MHNAKCQVSYSLLNIIAILLVELILCTVLAALIFCCHVDCYSGLSIDKWILWTLCSSPFGYDTTTYMQNFCKPGAYQHARVIRKSIYILKIYISAMCLLIWLHDNWLHWSVWCAALCVSMADSFLLAIGRCCTKARLSVLVWPAKLQSRWPSAQRQSPA